MNILRAMAVAIALAAFGGATAEGAVLLSDTFTYPDGNLVGQGSWAQTGATTAAPIQVTSGAAALPANGQDANKALSSSVTSGSIYYGVDVNYASKNATAADYAIHLSDGGTTAFGPRLHAISSGSGYRLGWMGSSGTPVLATNFGATDLVFGTEYRVIVRYDIVAGALNDTGAVYVTTGAFDPVEANNTPYHNATAWTGGAEQVTFAAANLRQGTNTSSVTFDDLVVSTTFGEAIAVPEPAGLALLALAGAGLMSRRRR